MQPTAEETQADERARMVMWLALALVHATTLLEWLVD